MASSTRVKLLMQLQLKTTKLIYAVHKSDYLQGGRDIRIHHFPGDITASTSELGQCSISNDFLVCLCWTINIKTITWYLQRQSHYGRSPDWHRQQPARRQHHVQHQQAVSGVQELQIVSNQLFFKLDTSLEYQADRIYGSFYIQVNIIPVYALAEVGTFFQPVLLHKKQIIPILSPKCKEMPRCTKYAR